MRTRLAAGVVLVAVLTAATSVWLVSGDENRPMSARVADVASGLRCPTCTAVSVADSTSIMAQSMRGQIRRQLATGRSPEQIRGWFAGRYGRQVLLDPGADGLSLLLWVLPLGAVLAGAAGVLLARRGATAGAPATIPRTPIPARRVGLAGFAVAAVAAAVPVAVWSGTGPPGRSATTGSPEGMAAPDWVAVGTSLERQRAYDAAAEAYREALRLRPRDPALRTRLAFVLVRDGRADEAIGLISPLPGGTDAERAEALLVLGLAQRAESMPQSTRTLREFLARAPDHPAAAQVRRLLPDQ